MDTVYQLFDVKKDVTEQWDLVISQASSIDSIPLNVMREQIGSVDIAVMVTKKGGKFTTFIWDRDHGPLHEQALNLIKMAVDSQTKRKTLFGANTLSKESDLGRKVLGESFSSTDKSEKILQIMHDFFSN